MTHIALLSTASPAVESALPALELLPHRVRVHAPDESGALTGSARPDVVIVDGTRDLVTARNNLGKPFARADELTAARERVTSLERQLAGDKAPARDDTTASHDNRTTAANRQDEDVLSPSRATARTDNAALDDEGWDEWEGWDEPAQPRTQQQINAEGSQRVRDVLAARHQRYDERGGASYGPTDRGPQLN